MNEKLSQRIKGLEEAETLKMARLSRELREEGHNVINLNLGEPDFDTPDHIKKAAIEAIHNGYSHYTPVAGYPDLRKAVCKKLSRDNGLEYEPDQIVVSTGAKQSLINIMLCLLDEGDEVIVPAPYWVSYPQMIKFTGAKMVPVQASVENDFKITPAQLEAAITPATKMLIYSSPCNPTGSVFTREELSAFAKILKKHEQIFVVSDEIYEYINYNGDHFSIAQMDGMKERTIIVNGVSKGFAMTGWRIGYLAAEKWIAQACEKLQGQFTSGPNSIAQMATIGALTSSIKPTQEMRNAFHKRRDLIVDLMKEIPGIKLSVPEGAFYVFPQVDAFFGKKFGDEVISDANDLCMYLLKHAHVSIVSGSAFGCNDCVRISFSASEDHIIEGMKRMKVALRELV
jgi:aspartate aminotransferase